MKVLAKAAVVIMLQNINVSIQQGVHLNLTQRYMSVISQ